MLRYQKTKTELYVNGSSKEDRGAWEKELHRQCAEVYVDPEVTTEEQDIKNEVHK